MRGGVHPVPRFPHPEDSRWQPDGVAVWMVAIKGERSQCFTTGRRIQCWASLAHMTDQDFRSIETHVGFPLPASYRATLSSYPFDSDFFAAEFMLPNDPEAVIELNDAEISSSDIAKPFFIGSDGGEERFFVDASKQESGVFVFELETGKHRSLVPTWAAFLDHIHAAHVEIAADGEAMRKRKLNKKWWEFWK
jgi:hypothetical protein